MGVFGSPAAVSGRSMPFASANHMFGRGAFRVRQKEDREDLWTMRK